MMSATFDWLTERVPNANSYTRRIKVPEEQAGGNFTPLADAGDKLKVATGEQRVGGHEGDLLTETRPGVPIEELGRQEIQVFLDWVYAQAVAAAGANPRRPPRSAGVSKTSASRRIETDAC